MNSLKKDFIYIQIFMQGEALLKIGGILEKLSKDIAILKRKNSKKKKRIIKSTSQRKKKSKRKRK